MLLGFTSLSPQALSRSLAAPLLPARLAPQSPLPHQFSKLVSAMGLSGSIPTTTRSFRFALAAGLIPESPLPHQRSKLVKALGLTGSNATTARSCKLAPALGFKPEP